MDPEQLLVDRATKGDQQAFAGLVLAYQVPVYNLCYRMLGSPTEAEDAAQETFVRAYTRLDTYDASRKFASWILSIASHYCVDRLRRRKGVGPSLEEIMSWRWLPDDGPKPEEQLLVGEQSDSIQAVLSTLPEQYRLVIVLRYWYDLSYDEIGAVTRSTASAVKSRLHRARLLVAERLESRDESADPVACGERRVEQHVV